MLELKNIHKIYKSGENLVYALQGIDLQFRKSDFVRKPQTLFDHGRCIARQDRSQIEEPQGSGLVSMTEAVTKIWQEIARKTLPNFSRLMG